MAAHSSGATCASDVFSATDSTAARTSPSDIERGRVASAQRRQQSPRGVDVVAGQQVGHPRAGPGQRRPAERHEGRRGRDRGDPARSPRAGGPLPRDTRDGQRTEQRTRVEAPARRSSE